MGNETELTKLKKELKRKSETIKLLRKELIEARKEIVRLKRLVVE